MCLTDWGGLKNFSIEQPINSLLASLKDISLPSSLLQAESELTDFVDQFCTFEEFTPSTKVPSSCVGRQLQVSCDSSLRGKPLCESSWQYVLYLKVSWHKATNRALDLQLIVQPWSCALIDVKETIQCTPAYVQLVTAPAYCAAKHESAAVYKG